MSKETNLEYRKRVLDSISPTYCAAKGLNATIWLNNGMTTSCHHPPAHRIPLEELKNSYKAIHNTEYKKQVRKEMIDGIQPDECSYCWKVENLNQDLISDRVYKSIIHPEEEIAKTVDAYKTFQDITPRTMEISFDNLCNFACSYCNASFSSTWANDIKTNGNYQNLISDGGGAYSNNGDWAMPYGIKNKDNPYIEAFWKWWNTELKDSLVELRITGGEATMSPDFWKLLKWWEKNPDCDVRLAVNSNLGAKKELIERLCKATHSFKDFQLYTSCEAYGAQAEYIRDGLVWDEWIENFGYMIREGKLANSHVMMTISALCLFNMTKFMDMMLNMKKVYGKQHCSMSFNILRFPSFMSVTTLPYEIRCKQANLLEEWLHNNWTIQIPSDNGRGLLHEMEYEGIQRLISYLRNIEEGHNHVSSLESRQRDFRTFFDEYDKRRGKNFVETFSELKDWYLSIPTTDTTILDINAAMKEGWVLNPAKSNPGSQDYIKPDSVEDVLNKRDTSIKDNEE